MYTWCINPIASMGLVNLPTIGCFCMVNVGKYTVYMDAMRLCINIYIYIDFKNSCSV